MRFPPATRFLAWPFLAWRFLAWRFLAWRFLAWPFLATRFLAWPFLAMRFPAWPFLAWRLCDGRRVTGRPLTPPLPATPAAPELDAETGRGAEPVEEERPLLPR